MLTMNTDKRLYQVFIGLLLCGLPTVGFAKGARRAAPAAEEESSESTRRQSVGAPQVLEIPPVQETTPSSAEAQSESPPPPNAQAVDPPPYENTRSLETRTSRGERERSGE